MLLVMGLAKMGAVIKFIPDPVIAGFTAGIGVFIWVGQWNYFFGLPAVTEQHFHERVWHLVLALPRFHAMTAAIGVLSLFVALLSNRIPGLRRVPGPLVAMVLATVLQAIFKFDGVATIGTAFGAIPQQMPTFGLPAVSAARVFELVGPAFAIAMLGAIESLLSAVVADGMAGTRHDSNQELIGQGLANVAAPLFGGFAATGAIARTATNFRNGGTSPLAGIVHSLTLVAIVLLLAPLVSNVPLAALAAILFIVAYNMAEIRHVAWMVRHAPRADAAILLITFFLTVFVDLIVAVNIGVILATLQFVRRMSSSVEVLQQTDTHLEHELEGQGLGKLPPGVLVYAIEGPFFFGAVENFERVLLATHTESRVLVLRLRRVPFMDITGLQALEEVIEHMKRRAVRVMLCEAIPRVRNKLAMAGVLSAAGSGNYFDTLGDALASC
jgi:SulP family sulfate permease